jgi:HSP20 family protein
VIFGTRWTTSAVLWSSSSLTFTALSFSNSSGEDPGAQEIVFAPAVESNWTETELLLRAVLPGVGEKDVKVTAQNQRLILEGERKTPEGWNDSGYTWMPYGKFHAAIPLPSGLNLDKVTCRLHDGVLDIRIPVAEQMKPRQIPIGAGEGRTAIAA